MNEPEKFSVATLTARRSWSAATQGAAKMVGQQIRLARLRKGWTAQELATRAGISRATVLSIESGTGNVALNSVLEACWLLGVELAGPMDPRVIEKRIVLLEADLAAGAKRARKSRMREPDDDF